MSEDGRNRLKDLAKNVREKLTPKGEPPLNAKGLEIVDQLAKELAAPEGFPGLRVWRDGVTKFRLERLPRNATITVEWQREIGALVVSCEKPGGKKLVRYVYEDDKDRWRRMEGSGEIWADIADDLTEYLYPEGKK